MLTEASPDVEQTDGELVRAFVERKCSAAFGELVLRHGPMVMGEKLACGTDDCPTEPIVKLWCPDFGYRVVHACREHAVEVLRQPGTRIVAAYQPDVALLVFAEAQEDD